MSSRNSKISYSAKRRTQDIAVPAKSGSPPQEVDIASLAAGGRGVAKPDGRVWFVSGGLPGDRVLAKITRDRGRFVEAEALQVLRAGEVRRDPACPLQPRCGGCPWMTLSDPAQLDWKQRLVTDALARIGGLCEVPVEPTVGGALRQRYRNKAEFTLGLDGSGRPTLGFHGIAGRDLVDVDSCPVQHDAADEVLASIREILSRDEFREAFEGRPSFRVALRTSWTEGRVLVVLREIGRPFPEPDVFAELLMSRRDDVSGVVRVRHPAGRRGGGRTFPVAGQAEINERIGGVLYKIPAASFLQVNPEMAQVLVDSVREFSGEVHGLEALDLYGGIGIYGVRLAREGAMSTICEADPEAIACGAAAVEAAGLSGVRFVRSDVLRFLETDDARPELIVANPPRTGLGPGVARAIRRLKPRRIVLVSCDPATFARDVRALGEDGLRLSRVRPVDVFPQTAQVEVVGLLCRAG